MITSFTHVFYSKCNNLTFKTNNETFGLPLHDVIFLAINLITKGMRLQSQCLAK